MNHKLCFLRLDPVELACPVRLSDPAASPAGYGSAGEQSEWRISPTGLPTSELRRQTHPAAAVRLHLAAPLTQCGKLRGFGGGPPLSAGDLWTSPSIRGWLDRLGFPALFGESWKQPRFCGGVELSKLQIDIPHQDQVARFTSFQGHVHSDERLAQMAPAASSPMNPAVSTRLISTSNGYSLGLTCSSRRFA